MSYFLYDNVAGTKQPEKLLPTLRIIEKTFLNLRIKYGEIDQIRLSLKELGLRLSRGESNHSNFIQKRTGEHIKLLTWVTIVCLYVSSVCQLKRLILKKTLGLVSGCDRH